MAPRPLGPDTLTWKYFGDWRTLLMALWAGAMQNMHPVLGAAVEEHSRFFAERWQRLFRSLYPIGGVVFDGPDAVRTARQVRGYHDLVKGVDRNGKRYHALDPDVFYWAHSTFFMVTLVTAERMCGGLSEEDKHTLYAEHVRWYELYGVSMRPVPSTWDDFQVYWDRMCTEVLEDNKATRDVLDLDGLPVPPAVPWLPLTLWRPMRFLIARSFVWWTVGLFPPVVRAKLGYRWSARSERAHRLLGRLLNVVFSVLPHRLRYHPRARAGWRRARGEQVPIPETPARNLPPLAERDNPMHYSPREAR